MAPAEGIRVSDAEREAVAVELREHFAQGRLTLEDFNERLDAAFAARTRGDLDALTHDLPPARTPTTPLPAPGAGRDQPGRSRRRLGGLGALVAVMAAVLIYAELSAGLRLPWIGKISIAAAVYALIRGLLRRARGRGTRPVRRGRWLR